MTKLANRALMTTATTGTGTITLGSAVAGYQTFADAGVVDADVVRYVIEDGSDWEIGTGTYTASGTTLTRTVSESSNSDAALNLTGSAVVFVGATAEDIPAVQELYAENPSSPTAPSATGTNAVAIGSNTEATGDRSIALVEGANATGLRAFAVGFNTTASGANSVAMGSSAVASASGAFAIGPSTDATSINSIAIGHNAQTATGASAVAIGQSYASGTDSFAAAIANNTSSYGASGGNSVAMGQSAKATGFWSFAYGRNIQSTSSYSVVLGGYLSTASKDYAYAFGHRANADVIGKYAYGVFTSADVGTSQGGYYVLALNTTDATASSLVTNGGTNAASTTNQIILPNNSAHAFHGTIVARQQASQGTACAAWKIEGLIRREGNAASTTLVASTATAIDNTPTWGLALSADTTNGGLKIEVTGAAATNIRWVCTCHTSEVTF